MAKKRLTDLCREYGIHFSEAKDIVDFQFDELISIDLKFQILIY